MARIELGRVLELRLQRLKMCKRALSQAWTFVIVVNVLGTDFCDLVPVERDKEMVVDWLLQVLLN